MWFLTRYESMPNNQSELAYKYIDAATTFKKKNFNYYDEILE